jgi:hypothetical protein
MAEEVKPSLHEIAAMPYPASLLAMRKHYIPDWGIPVPDGATKRTFKVEVEYEYTVTETETECVTVEAFTEEEAIEKAEGGVGRDLHWTAEIEIRETNIVSVSEALS